MRFVSWFSCGGETASGGVQRQRRVRRRPHRGRHPLQNVGRCVHRSRLCPLPVPEAGGRDERLGGAAEQRRVPRERDLPVERAVEALGEGLPIELAVCAGEERGAGALRWRRVRRRRESCGSAGSCARAGALSVRVWRGLGPAGERLRWQKCARRCCGGVFMLTAKRAAPLFAKPTPEMAQSARIAATSTMTAHAFLPTLVAERSRDPVEAARRR